MAKKRFSINGQRFTAEQCIDGVLVNPSLPDNFDNTSNDFRPDSHQKWWHRPYIMVDTIEEWDKNYAERTDKWAEEGREHWKESRPQWLEAYPEGKRYDVRCLDGGAWDRSTCWGMFATLDEALECAKTGPGWRK